jgi:hypothetical protein
MKIGIFQNAQGEWIVGKDAQNGGVCESKEQAEQVLALHNKYQGKKVKFDLGDGTVVEGKVSEVGVTCGTNESNLYVRYKRGLYKRAENECVLI